MAQNAAPSEHLMPSKYPQAYSTAPAENPLRYRTSRSRTPRPPSARNTGITWNLDILSILSDELVVTPTA
eukprot:11289529-Alexandrium_andersonii.AAC.1